VSEQFCDVGRGITLCYETFGEPSNPPLLLVMGLGTQMIAWHEEFCGELAARGLYVVRFDNRDIGRSTHLSGRPPTVAQLLARSRRAARYSLADMAEDAIGLLEALELAPAHVVGASMGGMIAQTIAARHPRHVRSLVSIMSSTGSLRSGQPALRVYSVFLRHPPREREAFVAHMERVFAAIGSRGLPRDDADVRAIAAHSYDRDRDSEGPGRQLAAILAAGNRTRELRRITAPTLVIHGSADPLIRPSGGRATARAIRGARLLNIAGMGHDLPRAAWPQLIDAISTHAHGADERSGTASVAAPAATTDTPLANAGDPVATGPPPVAGR
jgi:pimeloyl-ACP methyl ester carboxylesterase